MLETVAAILNTNRLLEIQKMLILDERQSKHGHSKPLVLDHAISKSFLLQACKFIHFTLLNASTKAISNINICSLLCDSVGSGVLKHYFIL